MLLSPYLKSFEDQRIAAWGRNMHAYALLEKTRDRHKDADAEKDTFEAALHFMLKQSFKSVRDIYRECLRLHIHQLVDAEEWIKARMKEKADPDSFPPSSQEKF